jgi:hypothetical protein
LRPESVSGAQAGIAKRFQGSIVEILGSGNIADANRYMVDHLQFSFFVHDAPWWKQRFPGLGKIANLAS